MTADELATIGARIFGPRWQRVLSAALGVNYRTVQRWAEGKQVIPSGIADHVRQLLAIATATKPHHGAETAPEG